MKTALVRLPMILAAGGLLLLLPGATNAQCSGNPAFLAHSVADGSEVTRTIPAGGAGQWIAELTAGRSYLFEVTASEIVPAAPSSITAFGPAGCASPAVTLTDRTQTDPPIRTASGIVAGRRATFTPLAAGLYVFELTNIDVAAHPFVAVLVETTLYNPLWSTFGGFETFYRFQNSTNTACNATLRMINDAGMQVANTNLSIPANSTAPTVFTGPMAQGGLNLGNDQAGQAAITHDCPPGAIQVDGFTGRFDLATPVVLPIKIQAARQMR